MNEAAGQLAFDLAQRPALGAEDFLISTANRSAAAAVDRWPDWPQASLLVVAPARAGKTHLGNVWRLKSGAERLEASSLNEDDIAFTRGALIVEDLHEGVADERVLFHLLNLVRERKLSMLLTSQVPAGELNVRLPDLRSRLRALPFVMIDNPDPSLLKAVLVKHFADRQLMVEPSVVHYIALHMEQSMQAAAAIVEAIDRAAMSLQRKVTKSLAAEVLIQLGHR
jgi:chromosomal replication initiation ATPase DnaA